MLRALCRITVPPVFRTTNRANYHGAQIPVQWQNIFEKIQNNACSKITPLAIHKFEAGDALHIGEEPAADCTPRLQNGTTLVKLLCHTAEIPPNLTSETAGVDVGIEIWLPDPEIWNERLRVHIQGGFMGDAGVRDPKSMAATPCGQDLPMGQLAADLGYVVASTDGGHVAATYEDMSYLMLPDGNMNEIGWKNIAWQASILTGEISKMLAELYYGKSAKKSYLLGCSTGGRQAYHVAQQFPEQFDGYLVACPSITQSLLFPSLLHPHIVIYNDLGGKRFRPGQLEAVSRKALAWGDSTVNGEHDGYITEWAENRYDPCLDKSVLSVEAGGECTAPWALSIEQALALNKIWYGPTLDGSCPPPSEDNGASSQLSPGQIWWGKIRGTRIDYSTFPRHVGGGMLALALDNVSLASGLWRHARGAGSNAWRTWTYDQYAEAMLTCQQRDADSFRMDADDPDLRKAQSLGKKLLAYHGLGDTGVAPQSAVRYFEKSADMTGGLERTKEFHRLFLIPGVGHCVRYKGVAGTVEPPAPSSEAIFSTLVEWTENGVAPAFLPAEPRAGANGLRHTACYPSTPRYLGGPIDLADSYGYEP